MSITLAAGGTVQGVSTSAATVTYTLSGLELAGTTDQTAGTVKPLAQGQLPSSAGVLYTVPGSQSAVVQTIHLSNTGGTSQTVVIYVNGTAAANELSSIVIPANGSAVYNGKWSLYDSFGNLQAGVVTGYAVDTSVVHLAGAETITGRKIVQAELPIKGPRPWIDVTSYGADPSGATDSLAAFNSALSAADTLPHGIVYVPPGDYRFSAGFTIPAFVRLMGSGMFNCRLVQQFTTGDFITMGGASMIEGFWIVGAYVTTTAGGTLSATPQTIALTSTAFLADFPSSGSGSISLTNGTWTTITWTGKTATALTGCTGVGAFSASTIIDAKTAGAGINTGANTLVTIRDLYIQNQYVAIDTGGVSNWIEDVWIRDCISGGVLCDIDDGTSYIHNLWLDTIYAQPAFGVRCTQGSIIMSDSNIMRARIGLDFPIAVGGIFSPFVVNCFLDNCADAGMSITGPGTPNVFDRGKFCQCWFSSSTNGVVLNNTGIRGVDFVDCDLYLNSANGIQLLAAQEVGIDFCRAANNTTAGLNAPVTGGPPDLAVMNSLFGPVGTSLTGNGQGIIVSGTLASIRIVGNNLSGNTGLSLNDTSTVANPGQKLIDGNQGLSVAPAPLVATPAAITTTEVIVSQMYLPANSLTVGTTIRWQARGTVTGTSPTVGPKARIGTLGTTADTQAATLTAGVHTSGAGWYSEGWFTVRSLGSGGACIAGVMTYGDNLVTGTRMSPQAATVAINTTVANFLSFTLIGTGTTPSITVVQSLIEVVRQ